MTIDHENSLSTKYPEGYEIQRTESASDGFSYGLSALFPGVFMKSLLKAIFILEFQAEYRNLIFEVFNIPFNSLLLESLNVRYRG